MFAIMFAMNWKIGLIALGTLPFLGYSLLHLYRKTKASAKKQKRQEGQVASRMSEVLSAIPLVQAFAREKHEEERFDAVTGETLRESSRIAGLEAAATRCGKSRLPCRRGSGWPWWVRRGRGSPRSSA